MYGPLREGRGTAAVLLALLLSGCGAALAIAIEGYQFAFDYSVPIDRVGADLDRFSY